MSSRKNVYRHQFWKCKCLIKVIASWFIYFHLAVNTDVFILLSFMQTHKNNVERNWFFSIHNESLIAPFILTSMYIINNSCISFPPHSLTRLLLLFLVPFFSVYFFIFCIPSWILNDYDENRMRQKMNFPFHVPPPYSISLTIMRLIFHHLFTCSSFLVYMYTHMHIYTWT